MFTGIVETRARVTEIRPREGGLCRLGLEVVPGMPSSSGEAWAPSRLGESIAVSGVCLTVVEADALRVAFDVVPETLRLTSLGQLGPGSEVNLERSLAVGDRLGGHFVTGHIDGTGTVVERRVEGDDVIFLIETSERLIQEMLRKGSIAIDGVSLTVVDVERAERRFSFAAIPHTLEVTTLGACQPGAIVNLETDALGKWVLHALRELLPEIRDELRR